MTNICSAERALGSLQQVAEWLRSPNGRERLSTQLLYSRFTMRPRAAAGSTCWALTPVLALLGLAVEAVWAAPLAEDENPIARAQALMEQGRSQHERGEVLAARTS